MTTPASYDFSPEAIGERARARAAAALEAWLIAAGDPEVHLLDAIADLVADLGHLWRAIPEEDDTYGKEGSFSELLRVAAGSYEDEAAGRL